MARAIRARGCELFARACDHDLEGIVGKWAHGTYQTTPGVTSWVKVKNPTYSQIEGRHELFDRRRREVGDHSAAQRPMLVWT